jgi:ATP-binding cassette subfamily B protein
VCGFGDDSRSSGGEGRSSGAVVLGGALSLVGGLAGLLEPLAAKAVVRAGPGRVDVAARRGAHAHRARRRDHRHDRGLPAGTHRGERGAAARERLIGRLLRLRVGEVDRLKPGDLMSRVTSDTTLLRAVAGQGMVDGVNGAVV